MTIHAGAQAQHLAVLRLTVFGLWFGLILTTDTSVYPLLPAELVDPRGLANVLGLPTILQSPDLVAGLKIAGLIGSGLCFFGLPPYRVSAPITAALIFYHDAAMKSLGSYANHAQSVLVLLALLLAVFPAADAYSLPPGRPLPTRRSAWAYRTPLLAASLVLAVTYSFIGARRLFVGGVDIYTDDSMLRWVVARTLEYGAHDISIGLRILDFRWLVPVLVLGMFVTTVFEVLSPLALRYRRFRWSWVAVIVGFHLTTLFTMNIFFWENIILIAVLFTGFLDWIAGIDRDRSPGTSNATSTASTSRVTLAGDTEPPGVSP